MSQTVTQKQCTESKLSWVHQVHTQRTLAARPRRVHCAQACVPAQPSMCHNTADPTVCLLSLLCATIQRSLLCACSAFYLPQYSRAYCVPAQPSMCHNTAEPTVCLLSLLCATIQLILLCACSAFYVPQYNEVYCDTPLEPLTKCQVSCTLLRASKNVKFQLSQNSTKLDMVARFRETIPTVKFVSSSEI